MKVTVTKKELEILIKNYLKQEGYYHTHFTFTNEAQMEHKNVTASLEEVVRKGVLYMCIERHMECEKECINVYNISENHECLYESKEDQKENGESVNENKILTEKNMHNVESANILTENTNENFIVNNLIENKEIQLNSEKKNFNKNDEKNIEILENTIITDKNDIKDAKNNEKVRNFIEENIKTEKKKKGVTKIKKNNDDDKKQKEKKIKKQKISNEQKNDQFNLNDNKNLNILKNDQNLKIDDEVSKMEIEKEISKNFNTVLDLQIENYDESKQIKNCDIIIENEANNQEDFKTRKINDDSINNLDDIKKVEFSKSNDEINDVINDEKNENLLLTDTKEKHYDEEDTNFTSENQSILIKPRLNYIVAPIKDYSGDVSVCAWNRSILATGSDDSSLRVYKEGKQIKMKRLHAEITSLAWSENNELSAGNYQGEIFSFNDRNNTVVHKHHLGPVFSMKYFNESLLSVSYDGKAGILNDKLSLIKVHSKSILDCDWIDKNNVLTCSADNDLGLINLNTLEIEYLKGHSNEVNCVSHKNNIIASSSDDTTNILWNITSRQNLILVGHEKSVYSHKWMNSSICSIGAEGGVITWDIETGAIKDKYMHEKSVYGLEYSVENNIIISGGADKNVIFYDDRVGEIKRFYGGGSVYDVKLSGNEKLLCICMADNCPVVLDLRYC